MKKVVKKIKTTEGIPKDVYCPRCKLALKTAIIQNINNKEHFLCANFIDNSMCKYDITKYINKINIEIKE